MKSITVHTIGNAHIDAAWLWRWDETVRVVRDTFASALDRMEETPEFIFTCSQVVYFAWMEEQCPELFWRIREQVEAGRWDLAGGWWVQPDCNIPSGESFVRQALYGQRYLEQTFNKRATIGYNPDTFGHACTLPQLLRGAGLTGYLFFRPGPHECALPNGFFWWESPDGSRVLACRPPHHYCTGEEDLTERIRTAAEQVPHPGTDVMCFYGVGDHGGGPTKAVIESILRAMRSPDGPTVRFAHIDDAYDAVVAGRAELPVVRDDLQHHASGCYAVHSEVKRRNREMEQRLSETEIFATLAHLRGGPEYPQDELTHAWQLVLFNQFHDILAGTSIPEVYDDANEMYDEAEALALAALEPALGFIASRADTRGKGIAAVVANPLAWSRSAPVELEIPWDYRLDLLGVTDPDGAPVPVQIDRTAPPSAPGTVRITFIANVPAMGHAVYRCLPSGVSGPLAARYESTPHSWVTASVRELRSEHLSVKLDCERGVVTSIVDLATGREILAQPGAELVVLHDSSDTWSHGVTAYRDEVGRFGEARITVLESGPVRGVVRVESSYGQSTAQTDYVLWAGARRLEGHVTLDWHEQHSALKLAFPLAVKDGGATYEAPYGHIGRPMDGEEEPGQQWIDVSGLGPDGRPMGAALLNDCKYGFDINDAELRMTVLRSPIFAFHDPRQIDDNEVYQYIDQGLQSFVWALMPHNGDFAAAGVVEAARELNGPVLVYSEGEHDGPAGRVAHGVEVAPEGVHIGALKMAEDGEGVIIRLVETRGRTVQAHVRLVAPPITIECELPPLGIRTFVAPPQGGTAAETNLIEDRL